VEIPLGEIIGTLRPKRIHLNHLLPLQLSGALVLTVLNEFRVTLDLSFDLLLQAINLVAHGLFQRLTRQSGSLGQRMCTYGSLSEFRAEADGSSMKLRWIGRFLRCAGARLSGIAW
jgi:hypothetical protein